MVKFVPADCVAPAGDDGGGLVGLAGVIPGAFDLVGCCGHRGIPGGVQVCPRALPNELVEAVTSPNEPLVGVFPALRQACLFTPPGSLSSACTTPGSHLSIPEHLLDPLHARVDLQERISLVRLPVWGASW